MKKIFFILFLIALYSSSVFAYEIVTTDDAMFVFKDSGFQKDSHRYKCVYMVDEEKGILISKEEVDLGSGEVYKSDDTVYRILPLDPDRRFFKKDFLKAMRINSKTGGIEVIVFCEGKFHYSKVQDEYINLSSGTFEIRK